MSRSLQKVLILGTVLAGLTACGEDTLGRGLGADAGAPDFLDKDTGEPCTPEASSLSVAQGLGDNSDDESSDQIDCREDGNSGAGDDRAGCSPDGTDLDQGGSNDGEEADGEDANAEDGGGANDADDGPVRLSDNCDALGCCEVL